MEAAARALLLAALVLGAIAVGGCGGGGDTSSTAAGGAVAPDVPGGGDAADVRVIDAWAQALSRGDIRAAAAFFATPSTTENGIPFEIRDSADARRFNESLPCGARLVRAQTQGGFTTATFRLIERPGPGVCGAGTGSRAATAFVIEDGKITDWRRVPTPGEGRGGGPTGEAA